jgi:hypothetical protein
MRHQLCLVGQEVAVLQLAVDDHPTQRACDELGGFGGADGSARRDGVRPDHRSERCTASHCASLPVDLTHLSYATQ